MNQGTTILHHLCTIQTKYVGKVEGSRNTLVKLSLSDILYVLYGPSKKGSAITSLSTYPAIKIHLENVIRSRENDMLSIECLIG
ncbi:hypothetical protein KPH14_012250 [Odynerus spinipes]|uniref:Uncharacterized protein n=1 Tax=Odynerus spinipes TaxID=1348599 RepID=A0AAD9R8V8_9HYME|nr:hypothetical protein KPH14_012250 [Odynerus spinipes]